MAYRFTNIINTRKLEEKIFIALGAYEQKEGRSPRDFNELAKIHGIHHGLVQNALPVSGNCMILGGHSMELNASSGWNIGFLATLYLQRSIEIPTTKKVSSHSVTYRPHKCVNGILNMNIEYAYCWQNTLDFGSRID